ncbi:hypothetical protein SANA_30220 [Gottschalkiaceae bacterium SANA]|nr:hypothetical protein SANA_30220 [Gottschalkiaceae bacterium SANA]
MKKIIGFLLLCLFVSCNSPVFGDTASFSPTQSIANHVRLQEILHVNGTQLNENQAGTVILLQTGEVVVLRVDQEQISLEKYTNKGQLIRSLPIPPPTNGSRIFDRSFGFLVEADDGRIFTNNGYNAYEIDPSFSTVKESFSLGFAPNDFRIKSNTILSQSQIGWQTDALILSDFSISNNPMNFENNPPTFLRKNELGQALPEGYSLNRIMSSDFGETENSLFVLINAKELSATPTSDFYIIQLEKSIVNNRVILERQAWIPVERNGSTWIPTLRVTKNGFEILEQLSSFPGNPLTKLHRLNSEGLFQDTIEIPYDVKSFDANGDQTVVTSWDSSSEKSTVYLVKWDATQTKPAPSQGHMKALIGERTLNEKTTARFKDHGFGLMKQIDKESGLVDYLALLKTEKAEVTLQIPVNDLFEKVNDQTRNLEIVYGKNRIVIPIASLDCQDHLKQLPCDTDATMEIHLTRQDSGLVQWTASLYVIEQVDPMTKLVHRVSIQ